MTRFSRVEFIFSTLERRWSATNGPFLSERPITCYSVSERSFCSCVCCGASFCPSSSGPTVWLADDRRSNALHRRRADGRPGSSQCRAPTDECRDDVCVRLRSEEHTSELQSHHDLVCRL